MASELGVSVATITLDLKAMGDVPKGPREPTRAAPPVEGPAGDVLRVLEHHFHGRLEAFIAAHTGVHVRTVRLWIESAYRVLDIKWPGVGGPEPRAVQIFDDLSPADRARFAARVLKE
jgi:hypothetical protein